MGWVVVFLIKPLMLSEVAAWGVLELIIGGLVYTAGAVGPFKLDGRIPYVCFKHFEF
jgi:channel protein (hemolysin III family)